MREPLLVGPGPNRNWHDFLGARVHPSGPHPFNHLHPAKRGAEPTPDVPRMGCRNVRTLITAHMSLDLRASLS